ncbi:TonB-dependent receptor [Pseudoalteromonas sp. CNC9-20]|uniref:TonB-dependent receptor plug domain-containing protein n=1 Tax=Pseudoalteromonas sp. CNC9-20 TaxID=2917750 RepID=UPI001EF4C7FA|nr:TonB-dependent receptor [Pseudoalteromonas sp. CNC9-20]
MIYTVCAMFRFCFYFTLVGSFVFPALAEQASSDELFSLSFEQLLDVQVDIASKSAESQSLAPSSVTLFTRQQIAQLGVHNAYQLMNYVPGMQLTRGDWVGAVPKEHARGVHLDSGNILVMINGERLNEVSFGKASVYTPYIPAQLIERVEFIRGPGSALYGSNAFLGVMNIILSDDNNALSVGIGENARQQLTGQWHQATSLGQFSANIAVEKTNGQDYDVADNVRDPLYSVFANTQFSTERLTINARYQRTELNEFLNLGGYSPQNRHRSDNYAASVAYQWLQGDHDLSSQLSYAEHHIEAQGLVEGLNLPENMPYFVGPNWQSSELKFVSDYQHQLHANSVLFAGVELRRDEQTQAGVVTSYFNDQSGFIELNSEYYENPSRVLSRYREFSDLEHRFDAQAGYVQVKQQLPDFGLTAFFGARYDHVNGIDARWSPRASLIYELPSGDIRHVLKAQYGESFRTPVTNELYSNDDITSGNANLSSEVIKTTELVWLAQGTQWKSEVVLFDNALEDFIDLVMVNEQQQAFTFANVFSTTMQGIEMSAQSQLGQYSDVQINYTQLFDDPISPSFKRFASVAVNMQLETLTLSANALWRDSVEVFGANDKRFYQDAYVLLGAALHWQMDEHTRLSLKVENLTDKDYDTFDARVFDGRVPGYGRQSSLTYTYQF